MNKKFKSLLISALFTSLILVILFMNISINEVVTALKGVPIKFILFGFLVHLCAYVFRTMALYLFLKNNIGFLDLLLVHFLHNFYVHIVPASLGEFSFPLFMKKRITIEKSMSVLVILRITIMALTIVLFLISLLFLFEVLPIFKLEIKRVLFILLLIFFIYLIYRLRKKFLFVFNRVHIFKKLNNSIQSILKKTKSEFSKLKSIEFFIKNVFCVFLSIAAIILFYLVILIGMGLSINIFQIIFVSSIGITFMILPIKSFGGFGTTEGSWAIGLMLLGFSKEIAIKAGFVTHIFALLNVTVFFFIGLLLRLFYKKYKNSNNSV